MASSVSVKDKIAFMKCCSPIRGLGTPLLRITTIGAELVRTTSLLLVKLAMI